VHEPRLEVAGAGLDHSTRIEAVCREPGERGLVEIVERGEAMFIRRTSVDVRTVGIAVLELRKPVEDRGDRNAVESRKHSTLTQNTDIVERRLDSSEHDANSGARLIHRCLLPDAFCLGGVQGRERDCYETLCEDHLIPGATSDLPTIKPISVNRPVISVLPAGGSLP
jgi:hypothetical protein